MEQPGPVPSIPVDERGSLAVDLKCKKCAYNLRGLREDGRCPECGTPVGLSTRGDLLRFADPTWVETVARGLTIILWMILVGIIAGALGGFLGAAVHPAFATLIAFCANAVAFYGVWLMTVPDPSGIGEDPNITARKVVRFAVAAGLLGGGLQIIEGVLPDGVLSLIFKVLYALAMLVGLVGEFAKFIFYEKLALRVPERSLAKRARFLKWAYSITFGLTVLGGVLFGILTATGPAVGALVCLAIPVGLAWLVFGVMTLFLVIRLRRAIKEQAENARLLWASAWSAVGQAR